MIFDEIFKVEGLNYEFNMGISDTNYSEKGRKELAEKINDNVVTIRSFNFLITEIEEINLNLDTGSETGYASVIKFHLTKLQEPKITLKNRFMPKSLIDVMKKNYEERKLI